jgi:hypothetical protein
MPGFRKLLSLPTASGMSGLRKLPSLSTASAMAAMTLEAIDAGNAERVVPEVERRVSTAGPNTWDNKPGSAT